MATRLSIPERLQWLLEHQGVSQSRLASVSGVSPQTITNALRHGRVPQAGTVRKLADALGVPSALLSKAATVTVDDLEAAVSKGSAATPKQTAARRGRPPAAAGSTAGDQIWKRVNEVIGERGSTAKAAFEVVARERKTTVGNVQHQYYRMKRRAGEAGGSGARRIVRHATGAAGRAPSSARGRSGATPARERARGSSHQARQQNSAAARAAQRNGKTHEIDVDSVLSRLERLSHSRDEATALQACMTLLEWARR